MNLSSPLAESSEEKFQYSRFTEIIKIALLKDHHWRESIDVLKATEQSLIDGLTAEYLIKIVDGNKEKTNSELNLFNAMISSDQWKKILPMLTIKVEFQGRTFLVFEKKGFGLSKYMKMNNKNNVDSSMLNDQCSSNSSDSARNQLGLRQSLKIVLKLIEISQIFQQKNTLDLLIADQIAGSSLLFDEDSVTLVPQKALNGKEYKNHVYKEYVKFLVGKSLFFPYSNEILQDAINCEKAEPTSTKKRSWEKADVWAIGGMLVMLLGGSRENLCQLVAYEDMKKQEGLRKLQEELLEYSFVMENVFNSDPQRRWSLQDFKQEVDKKLAGLSVSEDESAKENYQQRIQVEKKQTIKKQTQKVDDDGRGVVDQQGGTQEDRTNDLHPSKKTYELLELIQKDENIDNKMKNIEKDVDWRCLFELKECLESIMKYLMNCKPNRNGDNQQEQSYMPAIKIYFQRALLEPINSSALMDFFWFSGLESANRGELEFSRELLDEWRKLVKALIYSGNEHKALEFCEYMLWFDSQTVETVLLCAECQMEFGNKSEGLKLVEGILQNNQENVRALFLQGKIQNSLSLFSQALDSFKECIRLIEIKKNEEEIRDTINQQKYPSKEEINYELILVIGQLGSNYQDCCMLDKSEMQKRMPESDDNEMNSIENYYANQRKMVELGKIRDLTSQRIEILKESERKRKNESHEDSGEFSQIDEEDQKLQEQERFLRQVEDLHNTLIIQDTKGQWIAKDDMNYSVNNNPKKVQQLSSLQLRKSLQCYIRNSNLKYKIINFFAESQLKQSKMITLLLEAIELLPKQEQIFFRLKLSNVYIQMNNIKKAEENLRELLNVYPNYPFGLFALGKLLIQANTNINEAIRLLLQVKNNTSNKMLPEIDFLIGKGYYKMGQFETATDYLKSSEQTKQTQEFQDLSEFTLAKCLLFSDQPAIALGIFTNLLARPSFTWNIAATFYVGICNYKLKQPIPIGFCQNIRSLWSKTKRLITAKLLFRQLIEDEDFTELNNIKKFTDEMNENELDEDVLALFAEVSLESGMHPYLAMNFIQRGLKNMCFFDGDDVGIKSSYSSNDVVKVSMTNFGCLIQGAKIQYEFIKNAQNNEKPLKIILNNVTRYIDDYLKHITDTQQTTSDKISQKQTWGKSEFLTTGYLLQAKTNILLKKYEQAQTSLQSAMAYRFIQNKEIAYLQAVLKQIANPSECIVDLKQNLTYLPSLFLYSQLGLVPTIEQSEPEYSKTIIVAQNKNPKHLFFLSTIADTYFQSNGFVLALMYYEKYFEEIKRSNEILGKTGKTSSGASHHTKQIRADATTVSRYAQCLCLDKKHEKSISLLEDVLKVNPKSPHAHFWLAKNAIASANNYSLALKQLLTANSLESTLDTSCLLGECYMHLNLLSDAKRLFQIVLHQQPNNFQALRSLGEMFLKEKDFKTGLEYFEQCYAINNKDEITLLGLSDCVWSCEKDKEKSEKYIKENFEYNKPSQKSFMKFVWFLKETGSTLDPKFVLDNEQLYENSIDSLFFLGKKFYDDAAAGTNMDFYKRATQFFSKLLKFPNIAEYPEIELISRLRLAQIHYIHNKFAESYDELLIFIKLTHKLSLKSSSLHLIISQNNQYPDLPFQAKLLEGKLKIHFDKSSIPTTLLGCMKISPEDPIPYFLFALYLHSKKNKQTWKEYTQKGIEKTKSNSCVYVDFLKSLEALQDGDVQAGKELLQKSCMQYPTSPASYFVLGRIAMEEKKYKEALELFEKIDNSCISSSIESIPLTNQQVYECLCYQAQAFFELKNHVKAIEFAQKCLILNPNYSVALEIKAQVFFQQGNLYEAITSAKLSLLTDSTNPNTLYTLGLASIKCGNTTAAINYLQQCLQIDINYPLICLKLAAIYEYLARPQMTLNFILQHLSQNPKSIYALLQSTKLLAYFKKFESAEIHYQRLVDCFQERFQGKDNQISKEIHKKSFKSTILDDETNFNDNLVNLSQIFAVRGYLRKKQHRLKDACIAYEEAIIFDRTNESLQLQLAQIYSEQKDYQNEIKIYNYLINHSRSSSSSSNNIGQLLNNLGNAYLNLGRLQDAAKAYQIGLFHVKNESNSTEILQNLSACLIALGDYKTALTTLDKAFARKTNKEITLFLCGLAYQEDKDEISAVKYFEKAIQSDNSFEPAQLQLAQMKKQQGKISEAIEILQQCVSILSPQEPLSAQFPLNSQLFLVDCLVKSNKHPQTALAYCELILQNINKSQDTSHVQNYQIIRVSTNIQISRIYIQLHQSHQKSIEHLKICLNLNPEQPQYLHELSAVLCQSSLLAVTQESSFQLASEAQMYARHASNLEPKNAIIKFNLANILHRVKQYSQEVEILNECLTLETSKNSNRFQEQILNNLGLAYCSMYLPEKARKIFSKGTKLYPDSLRLHFNLGNLLLSSKEYYIASLEYEKCLQIAPTDLGALNNLIKASLYVKDFQKVANYVRQSMRYHPQLKEQCKKQLDILFQKGFSPSSDH